MPQCSGSLAEHAERLKASGKTIVRHLGTGSQGSVFEVRDKNRRRQLALKIMCGKTEGDYAEREIEALNAIAHQCTKRFLCFDEVERIDDQTIYLFTEHLAGLVTIDSLFDKGRKTDVPPALIRHTCTELLGAVHDLHQKGILHRDLKPENVMISLVTHQVKVIDFGFACTRGQGPKLPIAGTMVYMHPLLLKRLSRNKTSGGLLSDIQGLTEEAILDADYWGACMTLVYLIERGDLELLPDYIEMEKARAFYWDDRGKFRRAAALWIETCNQDLRKHVDYEDPLLNPLLQYKRTLS